MELPEILILTGSGIAAAGLFVLGVLVGMLVANRRADRAYELDQEYVEQAELERQQRLLEQQHAQEHAPTVRAQVQPRPVSVTDRDPTRELRRPYRTGDGKRHHRRYDR